MAFDDNEERRVLRLSWKVLLAVVVLLDWEQTSYKKVGDCALIVAQQRNLTKIEKKRILE
jgi:hypothetical protein